MNFAWNRRIAARGKFDGVFRWATISRWIIAGCALLLTITLAGCGKSVRGIVEPDPVGGPLLARRLTESQYRATVADIFAPDIPISARFEPGTRLEGLLAVGTSEAGFTPFSIEQYDAAARSVAAAVVGKERRGKLVPCVPASDSVFDEACAKRFVEQYAHPLLRRPVDAEEINKYVGVVREAYSRVGDFYESLQYPLILLMVSPEFLYRIERTDPDSTHAELQQLDAFSKATRLSFFLTNSTPDRELLRAASAGELDSASGTARQVDRLIGSSRFETAVRAFFEDMLGFDRFADLTKDTLIYPAFNSAVLADAQEQTLRTIVNLLITEQGDYRDLFTTRETFLTRPLGIVYRLPVATRKGWEKTEFPEDSGRSGILSHVSFLALHSHPGRSSPTLRGKSLREIFLCQQVPDPPPNVNFAAVNQASTEASMATARLRLTAHSTEKACKGCHLIMDPPGLVFEQFDGLGMFRTTENGAPIDTSGALDSTEFTTMQGLAQAMHDHPETPRCLAEKVYRYAVGRDVVWEERPYLDYLDEAFKAENYRVPDLMRTIALSRNFFAIRESRDVAVEHQSVSLK